MIPSHRAIVANQNRTTYTQPHSVVIQFSTNFQLSRLNVQVERYQTKLRKHNIDVKYPDTSSQRHLANPDSEGAIAQHDRTTVLSDTHRNHPHVPVSWGKVNVHTLGPLLNSYQDTIAEKDEIIQGYEVINYTRFRGV